MNYWRMQLHPSDPKRALEHAINSLNRGYIGLDFEKFGGDLSTVSKKDHPGQRIYWHFAHTMREGDLVLVIVHHYPFALVEVVGPYNYLKEEPDRTLGVVSALPSDQAPRVLRRLALQCRRVGQGNFCGHHTPSWTQQRDLQAH